MQTHTPDAIARPSTLTVGLTELGTQTQALLSRVSRRVVQFWSRNWFQVDNRSTRVEAEVDRWQNEGGNTAPTPKGGASW
ncbi:MAG: hypothetical protein ACO1OB_13505 [Archangium sp.]